MKLEIVSCTETESKLLSAFKSHYLEERNGQPIFAIVRARNETFAQNKAKKILQRVQKKRSKR